MVQRSYNFADHAGTTVLEVMVVVLIIAVLAGFALMQRGSANEQFQRQNVAYELKFAFERARFDSVKRRAEGAGPAEVIVRADGFTLRTDADLNAAGLESTVTALPPNISIARFEGGSGDVTVAFDKRGETTTTGATSPVFLVCNGICNANNDGPGNANIVLITATGTVNLLPGGATPQTFTPPTVAPPIGDAANIDLNSWAQMTPTPAP